MVILFRLENFSLIEQVENFQLFLCFRLEKSQRANQVALNRLTCAFLKINIKTRWLTGKDEYGAFSAEETQAFNDEEDELFSQGVATLNYLQQTAVTTTTKVALSTVAAFTTTS